MSDDNALALMMFRTPHDEYSERNGCLCRLEKVIDTPNDHVDEECLPLFEVRFGDGVVITAMPEELHTPDMSDNGRNPSLISVGGEPVTTLHPLVHDVLEAMPDPEEA